MNHYVCRAPRSSLISVKLRKPYVALFAETEHLAATRASVSANKFIAIKQDAVEQVVYWGYPASSQIYRQSPSTLKLRSDTHCVFQL